MPRFKERKPCSSRTCLIEATKQTVPFVTCSYLLLLLRQALRLYYFPSPFSLHLCPWIYVLISPLLPGRTCWEFDLRAFREDFDVAVPLLVWDLFSSLRPWNLESPTAPTWEISAPHSLNAAFPSRLPCRFCLPWVLEFANASWVWIARTQERCLMDSYGTVCVSTTKKHSKNELEKWSLCSSRHLWHLNQILCANLCQHDFKCFRSKVDILHSVIKVQTVFQAQWNRSCRKNWNFRFVFVQMLWFDSANATQIFSDLGSHSWPCSWGPRVTICIMWQFALGWSHFFKSEALWLLWIWVNFKSLAEFDGHLQLALLHSKRSTSCPNPKLGESAQGQSVGKHRKKNLRRHVGCEKRCEQKVKKRHARRTQRFFLVFQRFIMVSKKLTTPRVSAKAMAWRHVFTALTYLDILLHTSLTSPMDPYGTYGSLSPTPGTAVPQLRVRRKSALAIAPEIKAVEAIGGDRRNHAKSRLTRTDSHLIRPEVSTWPGCTSTVQCSHHKENLEGHVACWRMSPYVVTIWTFK